MHLVCRCTLLLLISLGSPLCWSQKVDWSFAISGDSRNCGDVIMPAIAANAQQDGAMFYWHLGDFRAIYDFDQDYKQRHPKSSIWDYETNAWKDFIDQQLNPFGNLPVYLALGNHDTAPPKTRSEAIQQFADWWSRTEIKDQRLRDDPSDHELKTYYHWILNGIDFVTLDNASEDQFDEQQLKWLWKELERAAKAETVHAVVLGMHFALPDSFAAGHSMNESAQGTKSGREVYARLLEFRKTTHKQVYVLASHSHFFMSNAYNTACRRAKTDDEVLPGWIIGTAGAVRYRLPKNIDGTTAAKTDVYGYLLGQVYSDGTISFAFHELKESDIPQSVIDSYTKDFVHGCFEGNRSPYIPDGPLQPPNCP
jgi:Calcineurin-like phosphoesterase